MNFKSRFNLPSKSKLASIFSLSFAISFTVLLFSPFDLYLHNAADFSIGWKTLLPHLLLFTIIGFIALSAVLLIVTILLSYQKIRIWVGVGILLFAALVITYLRFLHDKFMSKYIFIIALITAVILLWVLLINLFKDKIADALLLFLWGIFIAAYFQVLFLNGNMTLITGDRSPYNEHTFNNIFNMIVWIVIAILPLVLLFIFNLKRKEFKYGKTVVFTVILISGMQIAGLVSTAAATDLPDGIEDNPKYLSYAPVLELSKEHNILVFILDRFDVIYMEEVLLEYPELYEQLDGFTFYKNNISEYQSTYPTLTNMLTGVYYNTEGEVRSEYHKEAWSTHNVIDTLKENGYTSNLLTSQKFVYSDIRNIENRADNLISGGTIKPNVNAMFKTTGRLSLGRLSPYFFKSWFLRPITPAFGNDMFIFDFDAPDLQPPGIGLDSDLKFYNYIKQNKLSINNDKKVFSFIHLFGPHVADLDKNIEDGYHYDAEKDTIVNGGNYIDSTRACFEILNVYFKQMKANGVYDNTDIILVGDHGRLFTSNYGRYLYAHEFKQAITAGLLIKPVGERGELKTDAHSELSSKYFSASLLELASLPHADIGLSYFDIIGGTPPPVRKHYELKWESNIMVLETIYDISGDANNFDNWKYE